MRRFLYFLIPFIVMITAELFYINYRLNNIMNDLEHRQNSIEQQFMAVENEAINITVKYTVFRDKIENLKRVKKEPIIVDSRMDSVFNNDMILVMNN
ncbi:MAG: hypothetical protein AB7T22_08660 [Calditrichaceae bacterium]